MRQRGSLPGFSRAVSAIAAAMQGGDGRDVSIAKTVLSDPTLTQRVLALANSAMYAVFGQNINTVSKAVMVLGTDTIGHLALGLKLVEGLSSAASDSAQSRCEMEKAVLAGHIARQVASSAQVRDIEEAVVCAMLHPLGRMVAVFYLPEYWARIQEQCAAREGDANAASMEVLGIDLEELGRQSAQYWGLPQGVIDSMVHFPPAEREAPLDHGEWLAAVSTMSTGCAKVLVYDGADSQQELTRYAQEYAGTLGLAAEQILEAVELGREAAREELAPKQAAEASVSAAEQQGGHSGSEQELLKGVAEMQEMAAGATSAQLMAMGLETLLKGLQLDRTILFLHQPAQKMYVAGLCLGGDSCPPGAPSFSDAYQADVFHAALANDKMIFVENAQAPGFADKLPPWWKEALPEVRSFIILPLCRGERKIGFLYGDWQAAPAPRQMKNADVAALDALRTLLASRSQP